MTTTLETTLETTLNRDHQEVKHKVVSNDIFLQHAKVLSRFDDKKTTGISLPVLRIHNRLRHHQRIQGCCPR